MHKLVLNTLACLGRCRGLPCHGDTSGNSNLYVTEKAHQSCPQRFLPDLWVNQAAWLTVGKTGYNNGRDHHRREHKPLSHPIGHGAVNAGCKRNCKYQSIKIQRKTVTASLTKETNKTKQPPLKKDTSLLILELHDGRHFLMDFCSVARPVSSSTNHYDLA